MHNLIIKAKTTNSRKRLILTIFLLFAFMTPLSVFGQDSESINALRQIGKAFAEIAGNASPAVVGIKAERKIEYQSPSNRQRRDMEPFDPFEEDLFEFFFGPRNRQQRRSQKPRVETAQGTGFIISADGYILTNNHVVKNADTVTVTLLDESKFTAEIIGRDPDSEVAVIKIDTENLAYLELADSDAIEVGEWVLAIGNPFGFSHSVTAGIVSAKGRSVGLTTFENYIQTDAAINPGNSGGPLLNLKGQVVGINTAIIGQGGNIGIGFAIPINMAKSVYVQLVESGTVSRGLLGVRIQDLTAELAESFGLDKDTKGVLIPSVSEDSSADKAGIQQGDIIVEFEGKPVEKAKDLMNRVAGLKPGTRVSIIVLRDGKRENIIAELGERESSNIVSKNKQDEPEYLGVTVQNLTEELAGRLGYEYDTGVIVTEVEPGSEAERKNIAPGTLILQVDRKAVKNTKDFKEAVKQAAKRGSVLLLIKQEGFIRYEVLNFTKE